MGKERSSSGFGAGSETGVQAETQAMSARKRGAVFIGAPNYNLWIQWVQKHVKRKQFFRLRGVEAKQYFRGPNSKL